MIEFRMGSVQSVLVVVMMLPMRTLFVVKRVEARRYYYYYYSIRKTPNVHPIVEQYSYSYNYFLLAVYLLLDF